jgi:glycosyltransferase involved in cell wall biosynthesis
MPVKSKALSIIIPAYNEANRIAKTLQEYLTFFNKNLKDEFEIIVILNGCKDKTLEVVESFAKQDESIKHVDIKNPIGKGGAVIEGYKTASAKDFAFVDADNSTTASELYKLFQTKNLYKNIDCIIGSRNLDGSIVKGKNSFRNFLSWGFNTFTNLLFNLNIKDTQCGAKIVSKKMIDKIIPDLFTSDLAFDINLLVAIKKNAGQILEMPIEWTDEENSSIKNPLKTSLVMALSVIRLRLYYTPGHILYKIFQPLGALIWLFLLSKRERKFRRLPILDF